MKLTTPALNFPDPEEAVKKALQVEDSAGFHEITCHEGAVLLRMSRSALRRLDYLIRESLRPLPGAEIREVGGILVGAIAPDRSKVILLDFIAVESEYRHGPDFRPSEADVQRFAGVVFDYSNSLNPAIGYFRTHLRTTLSPRSEDENIMRRLFAARGCSIILIEAGLGKPSNAWFCQWDGGEDVQLLNQFPLNVIANETKPAVEQAPPVRAAPVAPTPAPAEPVATAAPKPAPVAAPVPPPKPAVVAAPVAPPPLPASPGREPFVLKTVPPKTIAIVAGVILVLIALIALIRRPVAQPAATGGTPLGLTYSAVDVPADTKSTGVGAVENKATDLRWNPASPVLENADRGVLDIVDGQDVRRIDLPRAQLVAGHYAYLPAHSDLTFVLTIYKNGTFFVEKPLYVHLEQSNNAVPAAARPPAIAASPAARRPAPANSGPAPLPAASSRDSEEVRSRSASAGGSFKPPPIVARTVPVPRFEEPPRLAGPETNPALSQLDVPMASRPPAVRPPATGGAAARGSVGSAALTPAVQFSEPVAVTRVSPSIPPATRPFIRREIQIHIGVQVDAAGKVVGAHPIDATDPISKILAPEAERAALQWRFKPALSNGKPVASDTVLLFRFPAN